MTYTYRDQGKNMLGSSDQSNMCQAYRGIRGQFNGSWKMLQIYRTKMEGNN